MDFTRIEDWGCWMFWWLTCYLLAIFKALFSSKTLVCFQLKNLILHSCKINFYSIIHVTHFIFKVEFIPSLTRCLCIPRGKNRGVSLWVGDLLEWLLMGSISADHTWNVLYAHVSEQHIPRNSRKSPFKSCTKASWLFALSLLLSAAPFQFFLCKLWFPHREIFGILTQINTSFPASYVDVALVSACFS